MSFRETRDIVAKPTSTAEHKTTLKQRVIATGAGLGMLASAMFLSGCQNQQTDLPTVPAPSDIASAPQTPGDTVANPDTTAPTAETTTNENVADNPSNLDDFDSIILARGYTPRADSSIDNSVLYPDWYNSWSGFAPNTEAGSGNITSGQAGLNCGSDALGLEYIYNPSTDTTSWILQYDNGKSSNDPYLPECNP